MCARPGPLKEGRGPNRNPQTPARSPRAASAVPGGLGQRVPCALVMAHSAALARASPHQREEKPVPQRRHRVGALPPPGLGDRKALHDAAGPRSPFVSLILRGEGHRPASRGASREEKGEGGCRGHVGGNRGRPPCATWGASPCGKEAPRGRGDPTFCTVAKSAGRRDPCGGREQVSSVEKNRGWGGTTCIRKRPSPPRPTQSQGLTPWRPQGWGSGRQRERELHAGSSLGLHAHAHGRAKEPVIPVIVMPCPLRGRALYGGGHALYGGRALYGAGPSPGAACPQLQLRPAPTDPPGGAGRRRWNGLASQALPSQRWPSPAAARAPRAPCLRACSGLTEFDEDGGTAKRSPCVSPAGLACFPLVVKLRIRALSSETARIPVGCQRGLGT